MVRLVQTYSVFKQIVKSICNEYSICFSSQNLPYSGASDFVLWGSSPSTRNNKNSEADKYLLRYFGTPEGTSSKHTPCLNNFAMQNRNNHFVCFSSPHKVFDFVGTPEIKSILAHFHNIIKTRNILKNIPRFWYAGRDSNPRPTGS